ncbi:hypothetical protein QFC20_007168 [Naganishia adeliensis]|uniref:Uncharacterized protein n=1 Tax=Naganishia adeliensis TaxID=92952 RepID=A0ACC2V1N0_9TREE|nr:hypothetical protein QFC20_007168 [Naganishia adeliensis]
MTLEKSCTEHDVVPQSQRKDEVVVLGKLFEYFYPHRISAALPTEVWPSFQDETWLVPIANAHALRETDIEQETPEGLVNRGPLSMADYNDQVAHAKAYLGIGRPDISPSPYLALCQGVPVILPYYGDTPFLDGWDLYHPDLAQHGPAALIGAPYVYSYHRDDIEGLYEAVRSARDNPIDRFIPDDMRYDHVRSEILKMLNTDWQRRARRIEDAREERGEPRQALVKQHILQRLFQRGNGWRIDEQGEAVQTMSPVGRHRQGNSGWRRLEERTIDGWFRIR